MPDRIRFRITSRRLSRELRVPLLSLCALVVSTAEAVNCSEADTYTILRDQNAVDTFQTTYGPCDTVAGSLEIRPDLGPITDLGPLEDLVEVSQFFDVTGSFTDLTGLHNLIAVGATFTISGGATPLVDLSGLTSLQSIGGLYLLGLNQLASLSGMPNLSSLGSLQLSGLPSLANLTGLPAVLDVKSLVISEVYGLTSLDGAPAMASTPTTHPIPRDSIGSPSMETGPAVAATRSPKSWRAPIPSSSTRMASKAGVPDVRCWPGCLGRAVRPP